jgi:hypothetical protein
MKKKKYIAVVGDLVASRKLGARMKVQSKLKACLGDLNRAHRSALLSPYTITLGDEFQALFSAPEGLLTDTLRILSALHPVQVRFSIGIGGLDTEVNRKQAIGMDGPAFHHAREAMNGLKRTKNLLVIASGPGERMDLENRSLELVSHMIRKWDRGQFIILLGLLDGMPVNTIAAQLRVTSQAVYKAIDAGAMRTIAGTLGVINDRINVERVRA